MVTHQRIAAIDIGTVRIGVAVSSLEGKIALPLTTVQVSGCDDPPRAVAEVLLREGVSLVVVGWPLALDGSQGAATRRTKQFLKAIRVHCPNMKFIAQDERFSSSQAESALAELQTKGSKKKTLVDSMAAALILQTYLEQCGNKGT
ncbi:MAG: Holliday junction resolvase RuvX [Proteobacteria bacterium]|nr:Holliday junction resolvase RuvX [Pseudomonadota bacterium]